MGQFPSFPLEMLWLVGPEAVLWAEAPGRGASREVGYSRKEPVPEGHLPPSAHELPVAGQEVSPIFGSPQHPPRSPCCLAKQTFLAGVGVGQGRGWAEGRTEGLAVVTAFSGGVPPG